MYIRNRTETRYRAAFTLWTNGTATSLAERNDMRVPRLPVFDGEQTPQRHFCLERSFRLHEIPSVAYSMHVHIDADSRKVESYRHRKVRSLASNSRKFAKFLDCIGDRRR